MLHIFRLYSKHVLNKHNCWLDMYLRQKHFSLTIFLSKKSFKANKKGLHIGDEVFFFLIMKKYHSVLKLLNEWTNLIYIYLRNTVEDVTMIMYLFFNFFLSEIDAIYIDRSLRYANRKIMNIKFNVSHAVLQTIVIVKSKGVRWQPGNWIRWNDCLKDIIKWLKVLIRGRFEALMK